MEKLNELVQKVMSEQDLTKEEFDFLRETLPWREDKEDYYAFIERERGESITIKYDKIVREKDNMYKIQPFSQSTNGPTVFYKLEGYFLLKQS